MNIINLILMIIINQKDLNSMITLKLNENFYLHQQVNYIYYKMRIDILKKNQKNRDIMEI